MTKPLLQVNNLVVEFKTDKGVVRAIDDISFEIFPGETVGIVGESGCGKTVTALSILGLVPSPPGRVVSGEIMWKGRDLTRLTSKEYRQVRGKEIAMVFQEPMTALNPVFKVGTQMVDVIRQHQGVSKAEARARAIAMLETVGIPAPERRIDEYPHQLSGGMRQRVMIAMAISCEPGLLLADEPTTALDVTTQAQVLDEFRRLQDQFGMAVALVTHDLGVIAQTCQKVVVMYCGKIVEVQSVDELFAAPIHPYTKGLLESVPIIREKKVATLPTIDGMVPDLAQLPEGCRFVDRCPRAIDPCRQREPELKSHRSGRAACYNPVGV